MIRKLHKILQNKETQNNHIKKNYILCKSIKIKIVITITDR